MPIDPCLMLYTNSRSFLVSPFLVLVMALDYSLKNQRHCQLESDGLSPCLECHESILVSVAHKQSSEVSLGYAA